MKNKYVFNALFILIAFFVGGVATPAAAAAFAPLNNENDECAAATDVNVEYEPETATATVTWEGETPPLGWLLVYSMEGSIDEGWLESSPEEYHNPEGYLEQVFSNSHVIYANMLQEGNVDIMVVAYCAEGEVILSDIVSFEMGPPVEEIIGEECEPPYGVSGIKNEPQSIDLAWSPDDGGLYHIAYGPNGHEMNEEFFHIHEAGSVIVSENPYRLHFPVEDDYAVYIRKFCGGNEFSTWVVPECVAPSGLQSDVTETQVHLTWEPANTYESSWHVTYGPVGFNPGEEGEMMTAYTTPVLTLDAGDLEQGMDYEFYVRADCLSENFSPWAGPGNFTSFTLPCVPVTDLSSSQVTHQSAWITWTPMSAENSWDVMYGPAPLNPDDAAVVTVSSPQTALTGLESSTTYELRVTANCSGGETSESEIISFTTLETDGIYCIPYIATGCIHSSAIDHLILEGENQTSLYDVNTGCSEAAFENKTDMSVDMAPGNTYFSMVSTGNFGISGNQLAIWIDFDDNGIFEESERVGELSMENLGFSGVEISIPEDANPGAHRMRVFMGFGSYPHNLSPCNDGDYTVVNGEVHDYTANILSLETCADADAGTVMDGFSVCPGEDFFLETADATGPAQHLERTWQWSPAGADEWTDLDNGTLPVMTVFGGVDQPTDFRYSVTCPESGNTDVSDVLSVTLSTDCYCIPSVTCIGGSLGGSRIDNVYLAGETVTLDNTSGGCYDNGYTDYSIKEAPDLMQGETYTLSVTVKNIQLTEARVKAWIDFDDDKTFNEQEEIIMEFSNGIDESTVTAQFDISYNVAPGVYRMRVRLNTDFYMAPTITGCNDMPFAGETEDYLVEIVAGEILPCPTPTDLGVELQEDLSAEVSWIPGGDEGQWELVYGLEGFDPDAETPVAVWDIPSHVLTDLQPQENYEVYVRALCPGNVSDWSEAAAFTTVYVSTDDDAFRGFRYYPNPTGKTVSLTSPLAMDEVVIFTPTGQKVLSFHPESAQTVIDVSTLPSGVYFMEVRSDNHRKVYKLVKEGR